MNVWAVAYYTRNVIHRNILINLKKKFSSFKVIELMKIFLEFLPVLYLNQKNIILNQMNDVEKIITFI